MSIGVKLTEGAKVYDDVTAPTVHRPAAPGIVAHALGRIRKVADVDRIVTQRRY